MNDSHETMYDQVMPKPRVSGKISNDQRLSLHYATQPCVSAEPGWVAAMCNIFI
jgi:hypothetical protein